MSSFQRLSADLVETTMSPSPKRRTFSSGFANQLLAFGDEYADVGQLWLDGAEQRARGHKLSGWFAGQAQKAEARELHSKGLAMQETAERALADLVA